MMMMMMIIIITILMKFITTIFPFALVGIESGYSQLRPFTISYPMRAQELLNTFSPEIYIF